MNSAVLALALLAQSPDVDRVEVREVFNDFLANLADNWQVSESYLSPDAEMCFFDTCMSHKTFKIDLENWSARRCELKESNTRGLEKGSTFQAIAVWKCDDQGKTVSARFRFEDRKIVAIVTSDPSTIYVGEQTNDNEAERN